MKSIIKFLLNSALRNFPKLNSLVLRVHKFALQAKFDNPSQEKYVELLSLLKPSNIALPLKRFGQEQDGGYVLLAEIDPSSVCVSLGIADDVSFDLAISPFVSQIMMFDYSISQLPSVIENSIFQSLRVVARVQQDEKEIDIPTIFKAIYSQSPVILKVDIEGSEWDAFKDVDEEILKRCDQIIFEFHNLQTLQFHADYASYIQFLRRLTQTHIVINSHANNWDSFEIIEGVPVPNVLEVTYVRKDLTVGFKEQKFATQQVNFPNNPLIADFRLYPFEWVSTHP
jgi:hypothetical protein